MINIRPEDQIQYSLNTKQVLDYVQAEREVQINQWGRSSHEIYKWLAILGEEVGECNEAALEIDFQGDETGARKDHLIDELIQVAAVAVSIIECLKFGEA